LFDGLATRSVDGVVGNISAGPIQRAAAAKLAFLAAKFPREDMAVCMASIASVAGFNPAVPPAGWTNPASFEYMTGLLAEMHQELEAQSSAPTEMAAPGAQSGGLEARLYGRQPKRVLSLVEEFDAFMEEKAKPMADPEFKLSHWMYHPMEWTLQKWETYPLLSPWLLELQLKSCTSFASERYFSIMHWILNLRRMSLSTKNLAAQALLNTNIQLALDLTFGEGVYVLSRESGVETWEEMEAELRRIQDLSRDGRDKVRSGWGVPEDPAERHIWQPISPESLALWEKGWEERRGREDWR
jgi:hypothetical protein